ncbi:MAG: amidase [Acidimicrobiales bacterium]
MTDGVRAALAKLDAAAHLGAVAHRDDAASYTAAASLDRAEDRTAWSGRTITVKDWIDVAGLVCEGEAAQRTDRRPERDATAVARLRAAGAIVVAKTQPGADHPIHGRCAHPLDPERTPGGSSSGEAALIGAGASSLGLGSDSGGSIRLPAAWCGAFGLKPSLGLVPNTGHFPRVGGRHDGRTVIGPMASSAADLATTLSVIAGPDGVDPDCLPIPVGDPASVAIGGMKVALVGAAQAWKPASSTHAAVQQAAAILEGQGAVVVDEPAPGDLDESLDITDRYWRRHALSGAEADRQLRDWDRFSGRCHRASSGFDIVLGPTVVDVAPLARPLTGEDYIFTLPWSLTGWPAVTIPAGKDPATRLPLAVQVAAPRWHDHVVLAVAACLEEQLRSRR